MNQDLLAHQSQVETPMQIHEAGVYRSANAETGVYSTSPEWVRADLVASAAGIAATEAAVGMASLPEPYRDQQMNELTYKGMTSAQYQERHEQWLRDEAPRLMAAQQQQERLSREAFDRLTDSDDDDEDGDGDNPKAYKGSRQRDYGLAA